LGQGLGGTSPFLAFPLFKKIYFLDKHVKCFYTHWQKKLLKSYNLFRRWRQKSGFSHFEWNPSHKKKTEKRVLSKSVRKKNIEKEIYSPFFVLRFFSCSCYRLGVVSKMSRVVFVGQYGTSILGSFWTKFHSPHIGEELIFKSIWSDSIDVSISKQ
jgi:hypothetical protein